jgi:hypothetical protein
VWLLAHARLGVFDPVAALGTDLGPGALRGLERLFLYVTPAFVSTREIDEGCAFTPCSPSSAVASSSSVVSGAASTISSRKST